MPVRPRLREPVGPVISKSDLNSSMDALCVTANSMPAFLMAPSYCGMLSSSYSAYQAFDDITVPKSRFHPCSGNLLYKRPARWGTRSLHSGSALAVVKADEEVGEAQMKDETAGFTWIQIGADITEEQKQAISQLPPKMSKRCKAFMEQIICFSPETGSLSRVLPAWVRFMKPTRADWLTVLKQLKIMEHPLYLQVAELALLEESFEANIRDYTKIIHGYGKQMQLQNAENTLLAMKRRGFICDQVTLTAMVDMYSKAGNLKMVKETFEKMKLLGEPLDKRSYGSMVMAYVRAGMLDRAEVLLREMDTLEVYAGSEVYKALLREYSRNGNSEGAQRVFDAIQLAGITPDARMCALLINAYQMAGESEKAYVVFQNMRKAGLEPSDKCVALLLSAYEKENKLDKALEFLIDLERDGFMVGKEAAGTLAAWFKRMGVVEEVERVLREYAFREN